MSGEKSETIADICQEMRIRGFYGTPMTGTDVNQFCTRIEAAYNRLAIPTAEQWTAFARQGSENAELREALRGLVEVTLDTYWDRYWRGCEVAKERVNEAVEKAKAALAKAEGEVAK